MVDSVQEAWLLGEPFLNSKLTSLPLFLLMATSPLGCIETGLLCASDYEEVHLDEAMRDVSLL